MNQGSQRSFIKSALTLAVCLLFTTLANAQDKPPMAEEVFKNIPALKGIPVDEFMDTMGLFSAALSMNCTDCHTKESTSAWEHFAEDTPLKQMTRKMTLMVNAINKNNFAGAKMVTCYTCHRGDQKPKVIPSLTVQYTSPFEDPNDIEIPPFGIPGAPTPDEIFNKYVQAAGGAQKVAGLKGFAAKGTYEGYDSDHAKVPVDIYVQSPAQRTAVVHLAYGDKIAVFDGRNGWFSSPDRPLPLIPLTGGNLAGAKLDAMVLFPAQLKQMATTWKVTQAVIDDNDVVVVQGTTGKLPPVNLYFDPETGLLKRMVRFSETSIGSVPTQIDYSDYRDVAGVKVPFKWVTTWTDNQTTTLFSEIQANAKIDAAKFAKPAPAQPPKLQ